ncbi:MAG: hypothetical protein JO122_20505 [Acetobacteraceae bacterium]|nr:hypothetical protein [Acetobacteraceae bacterium]
MDLLAKRGKRPNQRSKAEQNREGWERPSELANPREQGRWLSKTPSKIAVGRSQAVHNLDRIPP